MIGKTLYALSVEHIGQRIRVKVGGSIVEGQLLNFDTDLDMENINSWGGGLVTGTQPHGNVTLKFPIGYVEADVKSAFQVIPEGK